MIDKIWDWLSFLKISLKSKHLAVFLLLFSTILIVIGILSFSFDFPHYLIITMVGVLGFLSGIMLVWAIHAPKNEVTSKKKTFAPFQRKIISWTLTGMVYVLFPVYILYQWTYALVTGQFFAIQLIGWTVYAITVVFPPYFLINQIFKKRVKSD